MNNLPLPNDLVSGKLKVINGNAWKMADMKTIIEDQINEKSAEISGRKFLLKTACKYVDVNMKIIFKTQ